MVIPIYKWNKEGFDVTTISHITFSDMLGCVPTQLNVQHSLSVARVQKTVPRRIFHDCI